jgi:hypothetical protein
MKGIAKKMLASAAICLTTTQAADMDFNAIFANVQKHWDLEFAGVVLLNMQGEVTNTTSKCATAWTQSSNSITSFALKTSEVEKNAWKLATAEKGIAG